MSTETKEATPLRRIAGAWSGLFWTVLSVAVCLVVLSYLRSSGLLWQMLSPRLDNHIIYNLQGQLFELERSRIEPDTMVIGDGQFIASARQSLGLPDTGQRADDGNTVFLTLPGYSLADMRETARIARRLDVDTVVIQNSPYMWTDFWFRRANPNLRLWEDDQFLDGMFDRGRLRDTFRLVEAAASGVGNFPASRYEPRPESLFSVSWSESPRSSGNWKRYLQRTIPGGVVNTVWVNDRRDLADDLPEAVRQRFDETFGTGFIEELGFVADGFGDMARQIQASRERKN